jgi:outer membrane biosynthesis protein TonB
LRNVNLEAASSRKRKAPFGYCEEEDAEVEVVSGEQKEEEPRRKAAKRQHLIIEKEVATEEEEAAEARTSPSPSPEAATSSLKSNSIDSSAQTPSRSVERMSQDTGKERTWPALIGKGGKPMSPRGKLTKSGGGSNGGGEGGDSMNTEDSPRSDTTTSPRGRLLDSLQGGAGSSSSSAAAAAAKPKPDLRARALMSHKKMQEQFNPKKTAACATLSTMAGRLTRDELAGRAVVLALDLAESLHGRRPTLAEVRLIADMLRTLRSQQQARDGSQQHDRRTTTEGGGGGGDGDGDHEDNAKKEKEKEKKKSKKKDKMDTKEKKDKKTDKKTEKKDKKEKKEKKEKKKEKKRRAAESEKASTTTTMTASTEDGGGGSESGIGSGITNGAGTVAVLGGRLEYTEETKGENEAALTLATADTLKLKELVHAHLKHALSATLPSPGRSPRPDDQVKVRTPTARCVSCVACVVPLFRVLRSTHRVRAPCHGATRFMPKRTRACATPTKTHTWSLRYLELPPLF